MLEITSFSRIHLAGVIDVILPIQQNEFGIQIELKDQPDLLDIPDFYQIGNGNFWVALYKLAVVGSISLLDIGKGQGALRKMFVKKEFRGSGRRVAENLLKVLLEWCKPKNANEIFLGTTP